MDPAFDVFQFVVWDKDKIGKDFLGQCSFPLSAVTHRPDTELEFWLPLRAEKREKKVLERGELHIKVMLLTNNSLHSPASFF